MMNTMAAKANIISAMSNHMFRSSFFKNTHQPLGASRLRALIATAALLGIVSGCSTVWPTKTGSCPACPNGNTAGGSATGTPGAGGDKAPALPVWASSEFDQLPGWATGKHAELLKQFGKQCATLGKRSNTPEALNTVCRTLPPATASDAVARNWMERNLTVWQFQQEDGSKEGLLTGYFEPLLNGSRQKQGRFQTPLYATPADLIVVKLDEVYPELKGKRLRGRLVGNTLVPYYSREEWETVSSQKGKPVVWVDDKLDAFLLQVQGSGRVKLNTGGVMRLSYADQNGHPYKAIGRVLVERGELTAAQATIPGIRQWAQANPTKVDDLLNANPSVVFFRENAVLNPEDGPVGALGVPLTGELSLAVDRSIVPYGSLLWMDSTHPVTGQALHQGALAQDTGGAIRGRVRADYFWGTGAQAGQAAGVTRQPLKLWLLWPKGASLPSGGSDSAN